jgi:hypothetical protein
VTAVLVFLTFAGNDVAEPGERHSERSGRVELQRRARCKAEPAMRAENPARGGLALVDHETRNVSSLVSRSVSGFVE